MASLWNCSVDEPAFWQLCNCLSRSNIINLQIDQNKLPEHLYANLMSETSTVKSLSLRSNDISDTGIENIANALKINRTLMSLNLYHNKITERGAELLAEALKFNQSLVHLSLAKNKVRDEGIKAICKVLHGTWHRVVTH